MYFNSRVTHLLPRQGSLTCWSHSWPVQPGSHSQLNADWPVAWHCPCTQTLRWHGWHPGTTPPCSRNWERSCSWSLMYRLRIQPWKLEPFLPPEEPCWSDATPDWIGTPTVRKRERQRTERDRESETTGRERVHRDRDLILWKIICFQHWHLTLFEMFCFVLQQKE